MKHTEWEFLGDPGLDDVGIDDKAICYIIQRQKDRVGQQELKSVSKLYSGSNRYYPHHLGDIHASDSTCEC